MEIEIENGTTFALELPVQAEQLTKLYDTLFEHLTVWFSQQADLYENGDYGDRAIGFEFLHKPEDAAGPVR